MILLMIINLPFTTNKILSEKAAILMSSLKPVIGSESLRTQRRFTAGRPLFFGRAVRSPGKRKQDEKLVYGIVL